MVLVENVVTTILLKNIHTLKFCTEILMFKIVFNSFNFPQAEIMIIRKSELEQLRRSSGFHSTVKKTDCVALWIVAFINF
jgi:hypothetical protein